MPESNQNVNVPKILFLVLNWGLGHATRSQVLIRQLFVEGFEVHIGSDGEALEVLKESFPQATFHELPSYNIRYSTKLSTKLKLLLQAPGALGTMKKEAQFVQDLHKIHRYAGVISDNRPAGRVIGIPSAYITHQLQIKAGMISKRVSQVHARYYNRFDQIWVPDSPELKLSGDLSERITSKIRWIGPLSRLQIKEADHSIPWAAVLSGPEPARSMWEAELLNVRKELPAGGVIVRGIPGRPNKDGMISYLSADGLSQLYANAEVIIARSGYSTLMDLAFIGKKALLIPTPGQTEQEYLAYRNEGREGWTFGRQGEVDYPLEIENLRKSNVALSTVAQGLPDDLFSFFQGKRES